MGILVLIVQLSNQEGANGQHCSVAVEELVTVVQAHSLDVGVGDLALVDIFHVITELQPVSEQGMIEVDSGAVQGEQGVVLVAGPEAHQVVVVPAVEVGAVNLGSAFAGGHSLSVLTVVVPSPVQRGNFQTSSVQLGLVQVNDLVLQVAGDAVVNAIDVGHNDVLFSAVDAFSCEVVVQSDVSAGSSTLHVLSVSGSHQDVHLLAADDHQVDLLVVLSGLHVAVVLELNGNVGVQLLVCVSDLLVQISIVGVPGNEAQGDFLFSRCCCSGSVSCGSLSLGSLSCGSLAATTCQQGDQDSNDHDQCENSSFLHDILQ